MTKYYIAENKTYIFYRTILMHQASSSASVNIGQMLQGSSFPPTPLKQGPREKGFHSGRANGAPKEDPKNTAVVGFVRNIDPSAKSC